LHTEAKMGVHCFEKLLVLLLALAVPNVLAINVLIKVSLTIRDRHKFGHSFDLKFTVHDMFAGGHSRECRGRTCS